MKNKLISLFDTLKIPVIFFLSTLTVLIILLIILTIIRPFDDVDVSHDDLMHDYVTTTVVDKRYEEGYGSLWWYVSPVYYIISVDDNQTTWTTTVDVTTYGTTTIGTTIEICKAHNIMKNFE